MKREKLYRSAALVAALVCASAKLFASVPPMPTLLNPADASSAVNPKGVTLNWRLNPASDGTVLASYLIIKQIDETWDAPQNPGNLGSQTSYTIDLQPGTTYKWVVAAVDWSQRSNPWYQFSDARTFSTSQTQSSQTGSATCSNLATSPYLTKPIAGLRDYNGTYSGAAGTGSIGFQGGTLYRDNYTSGNSGYEGIGSHPGVDIPVPIGTDVYSVSTGCVEMAQADGGWGNVIVIRSLVQGLNEQVWFIYGHLNQGFVAVGQVVYPGTLIGKSGQTGDATGPHLHFQADRDTVSSQGQQKVQHPWFPTMLGQAVNTPDTNDTVGKYTYNPLYLVQGEASSGQGSQGAANVQIAFNPNPVAASPDLNYYYSVSIKNTGQKNLSLTKLTVGALDATQYINQWFGTTSLTPNDVRTVNMKHPISLKDWTVWTICANEVGGQSGLCWNATITLQ